MSASWSDLRWYYTAKGWVKKRRKALLWAAAAATGAGVCVYYAASWYRSRMRERDEEAARLAILYKEAEERVNAQLQLHFEGIQSIADSTTLPSMFPRLRERLLRLLDLSALTNRLAVGKRDPQGLSTQEKVQLWSELKVLGFTRVVSAMAALALLDLLVRVQTNVLARHMYIDTTRNFSALGGRGFDGGYPLRWQQRFLGFARFLADAGLDQLVEEIRYSVEEIMASLSLTQPLDSYGLKDLLARILANFLNRQHEWENLLLPSKDLLTEELEAIATEFDSLDETFMSAGERHEFDMLMAETRAILSSSEFQVVIEVALDIILNEVMVKYDEENFGNSIGQLPLARVIFSVSNLSDSFLEYPANSVFIAAVARHPRVRSFCAMVYSSSTPEIRSI